MPKDDINKTFLYYEKHQEGLSLTAIAKYFGRSINTIKSHIEKHPDYIKPGPGNFQPKPKGSRIVGTNKSVNYKTKNLVFNCPQCLLDRLDLIPSVTRKEKYLKAIKQYLDLKKSDRPLATLQASKLRDPQIKFLCPEKLINKLDEHKQKNQKDKKLASRTSKIIAAIELFCQSNDA